MTINPNTLPSILQGTQIRPVFGPGAIEQLGPFAQELGAKRALIVTDPGIVAAGHANRGERSLRDAGIQTRIFDAVEENPTTHHVAAGTEAARDFDANFLVGLGGGSAMDCAKGVNFILTNGGEMADYWGVKKAARPMLPMIAVPTTAGTGSEAQSFALITDPDTHQKMACGDKKAACRIAILDPDLIRTVPRPVAAATGIDAVAHAIETAACNQRNQDSRALSREAWTRLERAFESAYENPDDAQARADMLIGAHLAGAAIEAAMLGAAHALANPLTARFGIVHGRAVGLMLPHVIRFNSVNENPYADLCEDAEQLAQRVEAMLDAASLPRRLQGIGIPQNALPDLAANAAEQWTARFNPRPVAQSDLLAIYNTACA